MSFDKDDYDEFDHLNPPKVESSTNGFKLVAEHLKYAWSRRKSAVGSYFFNRG